LDLTGIRGPGAEKALKIIALVNRVIDEVGRPLVEIVPNFLWLVESAREESPLQASRLIKMCLDLAKGEGAPVDHLYKVINDINTEFKAVRDG
jgi:hypothetical protein